MSKEQSNEQYDWREIWSEYLPCNRPPNNIFIKLLLIWADKISFRCNKSLCHSPNKWHSFRCRQMTRYVFILFSTTRHTC